VGRERVNHLEPSAPKAVSKWLGYFDKYLDQRLAGLKSAIETRKEEK